MGGEFDCFEEGGWWGIVSREGMLSCWTGCRRVEESDCKWRVSLCNQLDLN